MEEAERMEQARRPLVKVRRGWYVFEVLPQIQMPGKEPAGWMGTGSAVTDSA